MGLGCLEHHLQCIQQFSTDPQQPLWCAAISDGGDESIFGDTFMQAFYTVFDGTNYQVGFAPVAGTCGNRVQGSVANNVWPIHGCTIHRFGV